MNILPLLVLAQQQSPPPLNAFDSYVAQAVKDWRVPQDSLRCAGAGWLSRTH